MTKLLYDYIFHIIEGINFPKQLTWKMIDTRTETLVVASGEAQATNIFLFKYSPDNNSCLSAVGFFSHWFRMMSFSYALSACYLSSSSPKSDLLN